MQTSPSTSRWRRFVALGLGGWVVLGTLAYLLAGLSEPSKFVPANVQSVSRTRPIDGGSALPPPESAETDIDDVVAELDQIWSDDLSRRGLTAAAPADWQTVARRMSLALVGSGLSLEEIRQLESVPEARRLPTHVRRLLNDDRHHYYWAERYARMFVGNDEGQFVAFRRRRFVTWLAERFDRRTHYDDLVRQLITAKGLWTDHPEVNFYTATFDSNDSKPDPVRLAARTSRVFLGLRIDCLQCHDDFLGNVSLGSVDDPRPGTQADFHSLAAFFTAAEFNGLQGVKSRSAKYRYKYLDADEEVDVSPAVPYGHQYFDGEPDNERVALANWITHPDNRQAARSAVNHVWALMFGRPIGDDVDNLPLEWETHPVIDRLVDDFIEDDFNLQRLIRVIAASGPFQVDSRADFDVDDAHEDALAVFPLVALRPEQVAGAIAQASRIKTIDRESSLLIRTIAAGGEADFVKRFGDQGENELNPDKATIAQRLLMMNGKLSRESIKANPVLASSSHLVMFTDTDEQMVRGAYLATLNRTPTAGELSAWIEALAESESRERSAEDVFWTLVNSSEFLWNH